jgi:hypothetical protein
MLWCDGASYQTHIVAPRAPNFDSVLRDKLRMNSPDAPHRMAETPVSSLFLIVETCPEANVSRSGHIPQVASSQYPPTAQGYRGTSLIRKRIPLGPYRRPMPRVLGGSLGGGRFLMSEVPLYLAHKKSPPVGTYGKPACMRKNL